MRDLEVEAVTEQENVLKGPPGLLFGLTLLVFIGAGIYFGQTSEPLKSPENQAVANEAALVESALEQEDARRLDSTWPIEP